MYELLLIIAGISISSAAMAVGIGGGILWTPLLILAYGVSPLDAISVSLLIQVTGLTSGTIAYFRAGLVNFRLSLILFLVALPGVIIGSFITINLTQDTIRMSLGIMAMTLAILFVASSQELEPEQNFSYNRQKLFKIIPIPAFFGFIMGFLSLGISEWLIPALRSRLNMPMTMAIGTSICMMWMLALIASTIHVNLSPQLDMHIVVYASVGTFIGAQFGAVISRKINERILKQSFIYLMTLIGIHLIFQSI